MREILFRGKTLDDGEWVYGGYFKDDYDNYDFKEKGVCHFIPLGVGASFVKVDPKTVGQFTGILDKNGNKIFEGDIIDIHQTVNGCNLFEIVWDKTKWNARYAVNMVKPRLYEYDFNELLDVDVYEKEIEVIGNINENKELL